MDKLIIYTNDNVQNTFKGTKIKQINSDSYLYNDTYINQNELFNLAQNKILITYVPMPYFEGNHVLVYITNNTTQIQFDNNIKYEKRFYIFSDETMLFDMPTLDNIIQKINEITIQLNKKHDITLRNIRFKLMRLIIPIINPKQEYFILPHIIPYKYISCNIAIVGNSKKILRTTFGQNIDLHTNVFRFNYAETDTFEKYCGSKMDIRVGGINCLTGVKHPRHVAGLIKNYNLYKNLKENSIIIFAIHMNVEILQKYKQKYQINNKLHYIIWKKHIFNKILSKFKLKLIKDPQCGLGFILLTIDLGIIPDIYGFDIRKSSDNFGYFWSGKVQHNELSPHHNINNEHNILKYLILNKNIRNFD